MSTHAKLSPSARYRWATCPGSVRLTGDEEDGPSSPAAIDGTHTHTVLEYTLTHNAFPKVGDTLIDHEGKFTVEADRLERVKVVIDYIRERNVEYRGLKVLSERKVDPNGLVDRTDMSGTVDVTLIKEDDDGNITMLEIIDLKDGMNPVEAAGNHQLEQYAVGTIALEYHALQKTTPVRLTIVQPKRLVMGGNPVSYVDTTVADMLEVAKTLAAEGAAVDAPDAPLVPGEAQCKYCRAKGRCPALQQHTMAASGISFSAIAEVSEQSAEADPESMSNDRIRQIVEAAPLIRQMLEGVEAEALKRLNAGLLIDGLKLVRGRGSRRWSEDDEAIARRLQSMGMPKASIFKKSIVTPKQAIEMKWEKRDGTVDQFTPRQIDTLVKDYITEFDGKLVVAPVSDHRAAVVVGAAHLFTPVVEEVKPVTALPSWLA